MGEGIISGSSIENITLPRNLKKIGSNAFEKSPLVSIVIPDSVEVIEGMAFYDSPNLVSVTLPKNLKKIEASAFAWCRNLEEVIVPSEITKIEFEGNRIAGGTVFGESKKINLKSQAALRRVGYEEDF